MSDSTELSAFGAYVLVAAMGSSIALDVRNDLCRVISGRTIVILGILSWYLLEAVMLPIALGVYSQQQYNYGLVCVSAAFVMFLIGYHLTSGCWLFPVLGGQIAFFDDAKWLWILVVSGAVIGFSPVVYFTGTDVVGMLQGILGMRSTWGGVLGRGRFGDARAAFLMVEMFVGAVAPFAAILLFSRNSSVFQRLVCCIVIIWPMLRAYGSGTRSSMITTGAVVLAILYWKSSPVVRKRMIIAGALCAPLFYGLMAAIVNSRGLGQLDLEDRTKAEYVGNEMFRELLLITSEVPSEEPYQYGFSYYVQLVNPIPRFLWPDKPTLDAGLLMARIHREVDAAGAAYLTISPGLIGEMYLNFGIAGILGLSCFGGWLVKGWDRIQREWSHSLSALMYYTCGLAVLFIMGRSFTMGMFYGLLSLAFLAWIIRLLNPHAVAEAESSESLSSNH